MQYFHSLIILSLPSVMRKNIKKNENNFILNVIPVF